MRRLWEFITHGKTPWTGILQGGLLCVVLPMFIELRSKLAIVILFLRILIEKGFAFFLINMDARKEHVRIVYLNLHMKNSDNADFTHTGGKIPCPYCSNDRDLAVDTLQFQAKATIMKKLRVEADKKEAELKQQKAEKQRILNERIAKLPTLDECLQAQTNPANIRLAIYIVYAYMETDPRGEYDMLNKVGVVESGLMALGNSTRTPATWDEGQLLFTELLLATDGLERAMLFINHGWQKCVIGDAINKWSRSITLARAAAKLPKLKCGALGIKTHYGFGLIEGCAHVGRNNTILDHHGCPV